MSHETIYRSLYLQTRGALQRQLVKCLRTKRRMRKGKRSSTDGQKRGQIVDAVSIHDRPAEITDRSTPGHWEGDLITGRANTHMATLVERYSRYLLLVRVKGKDTASVVGALVRKVKELPLGLFLSLTWDRGTELAMHKVFTRDTGVPVYFCDPKSPWQRGTNENTNGLVRQYFPKGLDLSSFSQHELDVIALRLNRRPRKILGFQSPRNRITGESSAKTSDGPAHKVGLRPTSQSARPLRAGHPPTAAPNTREPTPHIQHPRPRLSPLLGRTIFPQ